MTSGLLANIVWHSLAGAHARFSCGTDEARRYRPGFSPIVGFANAQDPNFEALGPYCAPGERFYCGDWSGPQPAGWRIDAESLAYQLVWDADMPEDDAALEPVRLGREHVPQMLALVELTHPGPFGPRTHELGEYVGVFEGDRLVAMAGERMHAGALREVSGVCTLPGFQGRGLARRLIAGLVRRQLRRRETPFLHVMADNVVAIRMYERMGFRRHAQVTLRVVSRLP
jgi:ribosomal protein S18 acetylase RimI-like enzyme